MKVVILCGGLGTRLREETEFRPKPMVEIGGRPILWHIMKSYAHYGFTDFILALGYKGEMIKEYFLNYEAMSNDFMITLGQPNGIRYHGNHQENGWKITLANTGELAMTGARIKRIDKYIDSDQFMLTYGDGLADIDLSGLAQFYKKQSKIGLVTGIRPPSRFGELITDGNTVAKFSEKPQASQGYINGGFFIFNKKIFDYLSDDDGCVFEKEPLEKLANDGELAMYPHVGFWRCMDTYRDLQLLNKLWESGNPPWKTWK